MQPLFVGVDATLAESRAGRGPVERRTIHNSLRWIAEPCPMGAQSRCRTS